MTAEYSNLEAPLEVGLADPANSAVSITSTSSQRVEVNRPLDSLLITKCSSLAVYINAEVKELRIVESSGTEINAEAQVFKTTIEQSDKTELHFGANSHFGPIQTVGPCKGTTVCLPEACNMIPATKEGRTLLATLSADFQQLEFV